MTKSLINGRSTKRNVGVVHRVESTFYQGILLLLIAIDTSCLFVSIFQSLKTFNSI